MTGWLSIPTRYGAQRFRSKLEADWARALDAMGMPWEYEFEGAYFGDVFYLPDFWLTQAGQYVEVKGAIGDLDLTKINALCANVERWRHAPADGPDVRLIYGRPDGWFHGWPRVEERRLDATDLPLELSIYQCGKCRGRWFAETDSDCQCRCCGFDPLWPETNPEIHRSHLSPWPMAPKAA